MRFLGTALVVLALAAPAASAQKAVPASVAKKEYLRMGISPTAAGMRVGESRQYTASYANNREMVPASPSWRSSDQKVLSVDGSGNVTAKSIGTAKVMVTDGVTTAEARVVVSK